MCHQYTDPKNPAPGCCSSNDMAGKWAVKEAGLGERSSVESWACIEGKICWGWIPWVRELTCRVAHGTGTKWAVDLCGKGVNSLEVGCGLCLGLEECGVRLDESLCCYKSMKVHGKLWGSKLRTVQKIPQLAVTAVEKHLGIVSLSINATNFSFCSLQGEILHILQADLGHFGSMD